MQLGLHHIVNIRKPQTSVNLCATFYIRQIKSRFLFGGEIEQREREGKKIKFSEIVQLTSYFFIAALSA